jgi:hypothetical protein
LPFGVFLFSTSWWTRRSWMNRILRTNMTASVPMISTYKNTTADEPQVQGLHLGLNLVTTTQEWKMNQRGTSTLRPVLWPILWVLETARGEKHRTTVEPLH